MIAAFFAVLAAFSFTFTSHAQCNGDMNDDYRINGSDYLVMLGKMFTNCTVSITYSYDVNGNRTGHTLNLLKSADIGMRENKTMKGDPCYFAEPIDDALVSLYPNPTPGLVVNRIESLTDDNSSSLGVVELNGRLIHDLDELK